MPELPDLEVFSTNLDKKLAGKMLEKIAVIRPQKKVAESELKSQLECEKLEQVYREGKELRFKFSQGQVLGMHLMLHGKLFLFEKENSQKSSVIELLFSDKTGLVLTDFQGAATIYLNPEESNVPDAMSPEMNSEYLESKFAKTSKPVKTLIMDQKVIKGIGNAYADEILWNARISPFSACSKIPKEKTAELVKAIKFVLKDAVKQIKEKNPDSIQGELRDFMAVHNSQRKESPSGAAIQTDVINSRKTYFTKEQELFE